MMDWHIRMVELKPVVQELCPRLAAQIRNIIRDEGKDCELWSQDQRDLFKNCKFFINGSTPSRAFRT